MADYCTSPDTLTLSIPGGPSLDLMSDQQGFRVGAFDLGYPDVREDTNLRPDAHGIVDLTRLFGARPITITGALVPSPAGSRQATWHLLAPFLDPAQRVTLTYRVDGDVAVKTMTLRPATASVTFDNPAVSPAQLAFKAVDPFAYDGTTRIAYISPSSPGGGGRAYDLTFNRTYPAGGAQSQVTTNRGDFVARPLLRLYGPCSNIAIYWIVTLASGSTTYVLRFLPGFTLGAGQVIEIDCNGRTVKLSGQSYFSQVDWANTTGGWPFIAPGAIYGTTWQLSVANFATSTALQVNWADPYLL